MRPARYASLFAVILLATCGPALATTWQVSVGGSGPNFEPAILNIQPGDTVQWNWSGGGFAHSVTSGADGIKDNMFDSGIKTTGTFSFTYPNAGRFPYFCRPHYSMGMEGEVKVAGAVTPSAQPLNVSTRLRVLTGQNAMIGGFIITGNAPKKVIVRAIGPSLGSSGVAGFLADPKVQLNGSAGVINSNDNWKDTQQVEIQASTIPPSDDRESAVVATLVPGNYTAIVEGKDETTGVALVEVYDLEPGADSKLANISTRGVVGTGTDVMIGGFILGKANGVAKVIVRALGPSLAQAGLSGVLENPTLELRDGNGVLVRANNDWKESQQTEIQSTGIPPQNDLESAVVATLSPGPHTAIVAGSGGTTGIALVEVYHLQ